MDVETSTYCVIMSVSQTAHQCHLQGSTQFIYFLLKSFFFLSSMHVHAIFEMQLPSCLRVNRLQH